MSESSERVYILIGGGGGQGQAVAKRLAEAGGRVVLASRSEDRVKAAAELIGDRAEHAVCDATDFDAVGDLVETVVGKHGRLDGVANLAGSILLKPAAMVTPDEFQKTMDLNVRTAFAVARAAPKAIRKSGGGSVVLMSSCAARIGLMNHEVIAAAKGAVEGLTRAAAAAGAAGKVRVNCVAPGLVDTPMAERITGSDNARKASEAMHPLGRIGEPADTAPIIAWLLGPESAWVTGQVIGVDGGLAAIKGGG